MNLHIKHTLCSFSLESAIESFQVKSSSGSGHGRMLQTSQIGVGPRTDFPRIETNDTECRYRIHYDLNKSIFEIKLVRYVKVRAL